ncbi:MAG: hypothetical protein Q9O62_10085 [Ardenticatenia bacterium]|nr:hypothetical protein [Ardenticatenia bacterium]
MSAYAFARAWAQGPEARGRALLAHGVRVGAWVALALGLTAWWLVPLWARRVYAAPLVRATLDETLRWLQADQVPLLVGAAVPSAGALVRPRSGSPLAGIVALWGTLVALVIGILLNHLLLVERLGVFLFDPVRFTAEYYYLALIALAGAATGVTVGVGLRREWRLLAFGLLCVPFVGVAMAQMWPNVRARAHPAPQTTLSAALDHPALAGLWQALSQGREAEGRVLFTSYYTTLAWPDGTVVPTAIKAMTPLFTGREIVGGTFSHWSPVARLLWVGDPWAAVLPERVEQEDGRAILGTPWEQLSMADLYTLVRALNVTTIVADDDDLEARRALDASSLFQSYWNNGAFYLYRPVPLVSAWAEGEGVLVHEVERQPHRWRLKVRAPASGGWVRVKMTAYPLWQARVNDRRVPLAADEYALIRVSLPPGESEVTLTYQQALPERAGQAISALSSATLAAAWLLTGRATQRTNRRRPP